MPITRLRFTNVGLFEDVDLEFDEQVNVFVGPNNLGKTTILLVIAHIVVYPLPFPGKLLRSSSSTWDANFDLEGKTRSYSGGLPLPIEEVEELMEQIGYTGFVPALRLSTDFRSGGPVAHREREAWINHEIQAFAETDPEAFQRMNVDEMRRVARNNIRPELQKRLSLTSTHPSLVSDESIIQKIIELDYRAYRRDNQTIRDLVSRIASLASEITEGFEMEFVDVSEDTKGLFPEFRTPYGDVPLNTLSQGTQSIIQ